MERAARAGTDSGYEVVSAIPGRIRVRFTAPANLRRRAAMLRQFRERLAALSLPAPLEFEELPEAASAVIRYPAGARALGEVLRDVETAAAPLALGALTTRRAGGAAGRRETLPAACVAVAHTLPGRVRLRLPGLARRPEAAEALAAAVRGWEGVRDVELRPETDCLVVRCDPAGLDDRAVAALVRREWQGALAGQPMQGDAVPSRCASLAGDRGVNPLLFPTVAVGLAAIEMPAAMVVGAMGLAALPIARRALEGARARQFRVEHVDLLALSTLVATDSFLTGGLMTWLIGLGDYLHRRIGAGLRREMGAWLTPSGTPDSRRRAERIAALVRQAPLFDTRAQQTVDRAARRLALPAFGIAGLACLLMGRVTHHTALLKLLDVASGFRSSAPATLLRAVLQGVQEGVFINGGSAVERLARVDALVLGDGVAAEALRTDDARVARALFGQGIRRCIAAGRRDAAAGSALVRVGAREAAVQASPQPAAAWIRRLRAEGCVVAAVGGAGDAGLEGADVRVEFWDGAAAAPAADVLLLERDLAGLPRAIERAREAMRVLEENAHLVIWPNGASILAVAGGAYPLLSTATGSATMVAAMVNGTLPRPAESSPGRRATRAGGERGA